MGVWVRAALTAIMLVACGRPDGPGPDQLADAPRTGSSDAPASTDAPPNVRDVRVPVPAPSADYLDLVTPEAVIQPGEEKMLCVHLRNDGGEVAIDNADGRQGAFGHHIALFTTDTPEAPGTLEDCTSADANSHMKWFVFNIAFPAGDAVRVPAGMPFVLQFHYINSGEVPILVRDVERLHLVPVASVTTWISTLMATAFQLAVAPGKTSLTWDCTIPADTQVMQLFGHMHELGSRYEIDLGADAGSLQPIYTVDPWMAQYRDSPRVVTYWDAPLHLAAGTIMRTTCEWENAGATTVIYPAEMCTTFAFVASETQYQCEPASD